MTRPLRIARSYGGELQEAKATASKARITFLMVLNFVRV
jgi:hypothetical protein